jgi:hypothetical protein
VGVGGGGVRVGTVVNVGRIRAGVKTAVVCSAITGIGVGRAGAMNALTTLTPPISSANTTMTTIARKAWSPACSCSSVNIVARERRRESASILIPNKMPMTPAIYIQMAYALRRSRNADITGCVGEGKNCVPGHSGDMVLGEISA